MRTPWPALYLCFLFTLVGCTDSKPSSDSGTVSDPAEQGTAKPTDDGAKTAPKLTELTPEMSQALGAAAWLPAGADFYLSSSRLGEQLRALQKSRAFQSLWTIPLVQAAWNGAEDGPAALLQQARMDPRGGPLLSFLEEALSREVFVYCGDGANDWKAIYDVAVIEALELDISLGGRPEKKLQPLLSELVDHWVRQTSIPVVVVGFKLEDQQSASRRFEWIATELESDEAREMLQGRRERAAIAGADYFLVHGSGDTILGELSKGSAGRGVDFSRARSVFEGRNFTVGVGVRGSYLLFTLGSDSSHLESFGESPSLAASAAFEPFRRDFRPGVVSVVHQAPTRPLAPLERVSQFSPHSRSDGLSEQRLEHFLEILNKTRARLPLRDRERESYYLRVASWDGGYEELEFGSSADGAVANRPLSILRHVGDRPLAVLAARSGSLTDQYSVLSTDVRALYGVTRGLVLANLEAGEHGEFEEFEALVLPLLTRLDTVLREDLLSAFDGTESAWVWSMDGGRSELPGWGTLPRPIRLPQVSLITEVRDREALLRGAERMRLALNQWFREAAARDPLLGAIEIPPPDVRAIEGGFEYSYEFPDLERWGYRPHALLTDRHLVLSLSPSHSTSLLSPSDSLPFEGADTPAIRASYFDHAQFWDVVSSDVTAMVWKMAEFGGLPREAPGLVTIHAPLIARALGAIRSYSSVTTIEEGREVRRSRLVIEDLPE